LNSGGEFFFAECSNVDIDFPVVVDEGEGWLIDDA